MSKILKIKARQVFDSRGNPTVEAEVYTSTHSASAICPSGASTGTYEAFEKKGMIFSGLSPDNKLPEIIELKNHPWFIGVQFHPEFKSRPLSPHPLFSSFIKAAKNHR